MNFVNSNHLSQDGDDDHPIVKFDIQIRRYGEDEGLL